MIPDPDLESTPGAPEVHRWEPLGGEESPRAYMAFAEYRDLGVMRTLRNAASRFYASQIAGECSEAQLAQFKKWSRSWAWVERAGAWDLHLDAVNRASQVVAVQRMNERQAALGQNLQTFGGNTINNERENLTVTQALKAVELGMKMERTARGEPEVFTSSTSTASDDEAKLERVEAAIDEVRRQRERNAASG